MFMTKYDEYFRIQKDYGNGIDYQIFGEYGLGSPTCFYDKRKYKQDIKQE